MYTREEAEGQRLKNPFDTITEGIGINRLTENFKLAELDGAFRGTDLEAVEMSRFALFYQVPHICISMSVFIGHICFHNYHTYHRDLAVKSYGKSYLLCNVCLFPH